MAGLGLQVYRLATPADSNMRKNSFDSAFSLLHQNLRVN